MTREAVILFGKYELLERINVGGMAEVFRARELDVEDAPVIAIKRILPHLVEDRQYIGMFIDEARVLVRLQHPAIIRTHEVGEIDAVPYIAMEYVDGRDARMLLRYRRRLGEAPPMPVACQIMARVCDGLHCAHELVDANGPVGLVHRDVSPQNVLLSYSGDVKLIDFGIVRSASNSSRTEAGVVKGKFGYMSPEQVSGRDLDRRSDVFAAGICLHELLTGRKLFAGDGSYAAIEAVRNADVKPPSRLNSNIPVELDRIAMRALARHPRDRFQTAADMCGALESFLETADIHVDAESLGSFMRDEFDGVSDEELSKSVKPAADSARPAVARKTPADKPVVPVWQDDDQEELEVTRVAQGGGPLMESPLPGVDPWDDDPPTLGDTGLLEVLDEDLPLPEEDDVRLDATVRTTTTTATAPSFSDQVYAAELDADTQGGTKVRTRGLAAAGLVLAALLVVLFFVLARPKPGLVSLSTLPTDVTVAVDGVTLDDSRSPFSLDGLSAGDTHLIEVTRDGHRSWRSELKVRAGQHLALPLVILQPLQPPPGEPAEVDDQAPDGVDTAGGAEPPPSSPEQQAPSTAEPAPVEAVRKPAKPGTGATAGTTRVKAKAAAPPTSASASKEPVAAEGEPGYLRLNSRPWSRVAVDGAWVGNTPIRRLEVSPGRHKVRLVNEAMGLEREITVRVKPGETVTRAVQFKK